MPHHRVHGQDHEGQQDVRHGSDHAKAVEHQRQGLNDQPHGLQQRVDHAFFLQHHHPCGGAHQQRSPKRQQHQYQQQVRSLVAQMCQQVGQRKAQRQTSQGHGQRNAQRTQVNRDVDALVFGLRRDAGVGHTA